MLCASIRTARKNADIVVLSVHWGMVEDRIAIAEYQREAARAFIDNGADLILGHGTLVTKGIELYKGKPIFYSLGKFLVKGPRPTGEVPIGVTAAVGKETRKGLAAMIEITNRRIASIAFAATFADENSRPTFLASDHPMFGEIADDIASISKAA